VHKGLDLLVRAIAHLPESERPILRLRGYDYKGGLEALKALVARLRLAAWVDVGGTVTGLDKLSFLRRCDGYVHPSRWESYGLALVENLALGVPCLVSDKAHIASELAMRRAALLAPPTVEGLANGLRNLSRETGVGERGRAFVRDRLSWSVVMPPYLWRLRELCAEE
jgi:glycosyltransferase involved in cell wall biosynthesis